MNMFMTFSKADVRPFKPSERGMYIDLIEADKMLAGGKGSIKEQKVFKFQEFL
jgi:hypothetical protein